MLWVSIHIKMLRYILSAFTSIQTHANGDHDFVNILFHCRQVFIYLKYIEQDNILASNYYLDIMIIS